MTQWTKRTYKDNEEALKTAPAQFVSDGGKVNKYLFDESGALITAALEHYYIHMGETFFVRSYADLGNNEVLDFTWAIPTGERIYWKWLLETSVEMDWWVYEDVTIVNPLSSTVTPYNADRNASKTSDSVLKYEIQNNLAAANTDTDVSGATLIKSGVSGAGKNSGEAISGEGIILKEGSVYCLRAEAHAAGYITFHMTWVGVE